MYYASVGDAAFLDAIADRATEAFDDLTSSAKSEAERVAKETIATIVPSTPAPRVGLSSRVGGAVRRAPLGLGSSVPRAVAAQPRPFEAAPVGGRGSLALTTAPFRSVSDQPTPFGAAPFQPSSTMVGPNLQVVPNYNQGGPRVASMMPMGGGMSTGTMVAIGAVVLVGLYFATQK